MPGNFFDFRDFDTYRKLIIRNKLFGKAYIYKVQITQYLRLAGLLISDVDETGNGFFK
jgi:hypothetical protein